MSDDDAFGSGWYLVKLSRDYCMDVAAIRAESTWDAVRQFLHDHVAVEADFDLHVRMIDAATGERLKAAQERRIAELRARKATCPSA